MAGYWIVTWLLCWIWVWVSITSQFNIKLIIELMANLSSIIFWNTRQNLLSWILILKKLPNLHRLGVKTSFLCQSIIVKPQSKVSTCKLLFCNISCLLKFVAPSLVDCCCLWHMFVFNIDHIKLDWPNTWAICKCSSLLLKVRYKGNEKMKKKFYLGI